LELLGAVEEEALFRLCDLVVDGDTPGVLTFIEELADQGQDLARLVGDLLEHLRHLMLVQHMGEVPDSLPVTDDTRDRLRQQANQLGPATVLRLIDLLAVAVEDVRQGGDPRLPLELALVKVTQPEHDVSREAMVLRLEQLEARLSRVSLAPAAAAAPREPSSRPEPPGTPVEAPTQPAAAATEPAPGRVDLEHLRQQWEPVVLTEVTSRSIPVGSMFRESKPVELDGRSLVIEFPASASFHRNLAEDPKNADVLAEVLAEITGQRLSLSFRVGEDPRHETTDEVEQPAGEDDLVSLFKQTFDAREINETQ
jgi:DNA polymerase-3 subunit gamma/tau